MGGRQGRNMDRTEGTLTTKAEIGIMQSEAKECGSHHKTEQARERFFLKASQGGLVFGSVKLISYL